MVGDPGIYHEFESTIPDDETEGLIKPQAHWNAKHKPVKLLGYELVEEKEDLSNVFNVIFENLDGNTDLEYLLELEIDPVTCNSNEIAHIQFNNDSEAHYHFEEQYQVGSNIGYGASSNLVCILSSFNENLVQRHGTLKIHAKAGKKRMMEGKLVRESTNHICQSSVMGYWTDTTNNITSLSIVGSFNFSGTIRLWKKLPLNDE